MSTSPRSPAYDIYDDRTESGWRIDGYPRTFTRTPDSPRIARALTLTELTGPFGLHRRLRVDTADLSRARPDAQRAQGQLIVVRGRVCDEDGAAIAGALVEMWQANASGRYVHEYDAQSAAPIDPNFNGSGRFVTDDAGAFSFTTIKPGAYPVPNSGHWWRPPHIHFSVFGPSWMARLVTQMFFPGDPLNPEDRILDSIPDPAARSRAVARSRPTTEGPDDALVFEHDFVLRGHRRTPEL
jgi:protocatechuate 3,4-dioxygenase beta subunit